MPTIRATDRLLHSLALGSRAVMETSFDIEWAIFGNRARTRRIDRPIFICGLARAGTSIISRILAGASGAASPTYQDMPFALAPNLWARVAGRQRSVVAVERHHGDGLLHDLNTPEALEEVFWRCFEGSQYLKSDAVVAHRPRRQTERLFRRYIALILLRGNGQRYVSKNNNNSFRLTTLARWFPDAIFVHPFRHPAAHCASLQRQHERALHLQQQDPYRLKYANWLGHHEFGQGRLPFAVKPSGQPQTADWMLQWSAVYGQLLDQSKEVQCRQFFLDFDALCAAPREMLAKLATFTQLDIADGAQVRQRFAVSDQVPADVAATYEKLRLRHVGMEDAPAGSNLPAP